jgi:hypothetical protein
LLGVQKYVLGGCGVHVQNTNLMHLSRDYVYDGTGAFEVNPLVARLTLLFGRLGGVFMSKVIAVVIALGVKRLLWVVNLFYLGVVCSNIVVLILLALKPGWQ